MGNNLISANQHNKNINANLIAEQRPTGVRCSICKEELFYTPIETLTSPMLYPVVCINGHKEYIS